MNAKAGAEGASEDRGDKLGNGGPAQDAGNVGPVARAGKAGKGVTRGGSASHGGGAGGTGGASCGAVRSSSASRGAKKGGKSGTRTGAPTDPAAVTGRTVVVETASEATGVVGVSLIGQKATGDNVGAGIGRVWAGGRPSGAGGSAGGALETCYSGEEERVQRPLSVGGTVGGWTTSPGRRERSGSSGKKFS